VLFGPTHRSGDDGLQTICNPRGAPVGQGRRRSPPTLERIDCTNDHPVDDTINDTYASGIPEPLVFAFGE